MLDEIPSPWRFAAHAKIAECVCSPYDKRRLVLLLLDAHVMRISSHLVLVTSKSLLVLSSPE
jgi:hypothetical protein